MPGRVRRLRGLTALRARTAAACGSAVAAAPAGPRAVTAAVTPTLAEPLQQRARRISRSSSDFEALASGPSVALRRGERDQAELAGNAQPAGQRDRHADGERVAVAKRQLRRPAAAHAQAVARRAHADVRMPPLIAPPLARNAARPYGRAEPGGPVVAAAGGADRAAGAVLRGTARDVAERARIAVGVRVEHLRLARCPGCRRARSRRR